MQLPNLAPYLAAVPTAITAITWWFNTFGAGRERRLDRHMELLAKLPKDSSAAIEIASLVNYEAKRLAQRECARLSRSVNWSTVGVAFFMLAIATPTVYFLWTFADGMEPFWFWVLKILAVVIAIPITLLVVVGGGSNLWKIEILNQE